MQQWLLPGSLDLYESQREKTNISVFDQIQHNPGCTATGAGKRLSDCTSYVAKTKAAS